LNIYVGNLPKSTDEDAVRKLFEAYGEVTEVKLIRDNYTKELRGFGFVEMPAKADAQNAIKEIDGKEIDGRKLIVNEARPRTEKPGNRPRSGGAGSGGGAHRGPRTRSW